MGDEKSITEKLTDAISKAADSVKSAVSHVVDSASDAAQHAMEANAEKISRIPPAISDPARVAGTANEQIYIPETSDAAAMPMPLFPVAPARKKKPAPKKTAAKSAKKAAKHLPAKKSKSSAGRNGVVKNKKTVKKTGKPAEQSKRGSRRS
jgi:hypothetical protein